MAQPILQIPFSLDRAELVACATYPELVLLVNQKLQALHDQVMPALQSVMKIELDLPPEPAEKPE